MDFCRQLHRRSQHHSSARTRVGILRLGMIATLSVFSFPPLVQADLKIVNGTGTHLLGQHDTKEDATRLATEAAKRDALEQVATYLESVTISSEFEITREEIRSYTAGVVTVIDQQLTIHADGDQVTFQVELTAQVDTDDVAEAIRTLREHEEASQELAALRSEVDQLQEELERTNRALANAGSPDEARVLADRRVELLNSMQSNALVQQAWSDWMLMGSTYGWPYGYGSPYAATIPGLLALAGRLNPHNPHVPFGAAIVSTQRGAPIPPSPPLPPAPPGNSPNIPIHQQVGSPMQVPPNALSGHWPGNRGPRRLQSFLPQHGSSNTGPARPGHSQGAASPHGGQSSVLPQGQRRLQSMFPQASSFGLSRHGPSHSRIHAQQHHPRLSDTQVRSGTRPRAYGGRH